jgi:hypothetical protein
MNTYFEEILTVVQSEQFANEFKSTIQFILRLVNLLLLVIAGLFTLVKEFVCRQLGDCKEGALDEGINEEALDEGINEELSLKEETLPNQITELMETNDESTDEDINEGVINEKALDEVINESTDEGVITEASNVETDKGINVEALDESTDDVDLTEEDINNQSNDVDLTVEDINVETDNDKSIRQKQLKQMKATELRKLCADYSLQYQNKQQAIGAIFQFEWGQLQANAVTI